MASSRGAPFATPVLIHSVAGLALPASAAATTGVVEENCFLTANIGVGDVVRGQLGAGSMPISGKLRFRCDQESLVPIYLSISGL